MDKKYELLKDDFIKWDWRTLYRIKALKDFGNIKAGDIGGYVESEANLSHEENCWIYDNAMIFGNAKVFNNAHIYNDAKVYGNAKVYGFGQVHDNARIYGNAKVFGNAQVFCKALVFDDAIVNKGSIIGRISLPYKDIFQYQCEERFLTAILTENDEILYTIGCQENITEEELIKRIHDKDGGLEKNPHRAEYLKLIPIINMYLKGE